MSEPSTMDEAVQLIDRQHQLIKAYELIIKDVELKLVCSLASDTTLEDIVKILAIISEIRSDHPIGVRSVIAEDVLYKLLQLPSLRSAPGLSDNLFNWLVERRKK